MPDIFSKFLGCIAFRIKRDHDQLNIIGFCAKFSKRLSNICQCSRANIGAEGGELVSKLYKSGVRYLKDIPDNTELSFSQKIQIEAEITKNPYLEEVKLKHFTDSLKFPFYFLDFETVNPALPLYIKTKPYQHIPFLYSLHIQENMDSQIQHFSSIRFD